MLRTLALSVIFALTTAACDKGGAEKQPEKKAPEAEPEKAPEPEPEKTEGGGTTGAAEPTGTTTGAELAAETGEPAADGAEPAADGGDKGDGGAANAEDGGVKGDGGKDEGGKSDGGEKTAAIDGKALFEGKCKSCHGSDGKGETTIGKKVGIPSLVATKLSKSEVIKVIEKGVPDTKMKGYKDKMSADEIAAVAAYVKKL